MAFYELLDTGIRNTQVAFWREPDRNPALGYGLSWINMLSVILPLSRIYALCRVPFYIASQKTVADLIFYYLKNAEPIFIIFGMLSP